MVLDTNVLISGLMLPSSLPGRIVKAWRAGAFDLVLSEPMLEEIGRVLAYQKIRKRLDWGEEEISNFLLLLHFKAEMVAIDGVTATVPDDEADTPVLAALIAGGELLVSGDSDLLALREDYPILTPAEFAQRL
ncbi:putative toxin-antitoxin system toxin component, PIN family [Endothiovibrio diazotrophicus]